MLQSDCRSKTKSHELKPQPNHITFVEIDHETISMAILPLCWFKKGSCQLLAKVISICIKYSYQMIWYTAEPRKWWFIPCVECVSSNCHLSHVSGMAYSWGLILVTRSLLSFYHLMQKMSPSQVTFHYLKKCNALQIAFSIWQHTWSNGDKIVSPYYFRSVVVTMLLHQPGPQLKLPNWRNKSIYAISVNKIKSYCFCSGFS